MVARGGMEEVELLEHDVDAAEPVDHVAHARGVVLDHARAVLGWIRRHRVAAVVTVAGTVVAVAVPAVLSVRADRARADALATQPGIAALLAAPPEVVWTSPPAPGSFAMTVPGRAWVRDDVLVLWEQTGDSTNSLRAVDLRSGDDLWTTALSSAPDLGDATSRAIYDPTTCSAPDQGVVVCLVTESWQLTASTDATQPDLVEAAILRLRAFAVGTGETLLDQEVATDASVAPIGPDVVVVETPQDGPAHLVRLDPATGTEQWEVDVPRPAGGIGSASASVQVVDDVIEVPWLGSTALLTGDGEVTGSLDGDSFRHLRGHRVMTTESQLRDLDTGRVLDLGEAQTPWLATDDRSEPGLLLLQSDDRLSARDLATGHRAWRVDWPSERTLNLVVVDGLLARQADDGLTVLDLATGTQLWHRSMSAHGQSMVTDGRRLVVIESVVGTGPVVAAYDARDGRRVWEVPVPVTVQGLAVIDHRLFAVGNGGVVALGAAGGW